MSNGRKKFQPTISPMNSVKLSQIPTSILDLVIYRSLDNLKSTAESNPELEIIYIVQDDSTKFNLKPIRDRNGGFYTFLILKDEKL